VFVYRKNNTSNHHNFYWRISGIIWSIKQQLLLEVCINLGLVAQKIMFGSGPGSCLVQMEAIKKIEYFGLSCVIFFAKKKLFVMALILCLWHSWAPTDLIFSGIFIAATFQK
jgi:hypothetical protein